MSEVYEAGRLPMEHKVSDEYQVLEHLGHGEGTVIRTGRFPVAIPGGQDGHAQADARMMALDLAADATAIAGSVGASYTVRRVQAYEVTA